MKKYYHYYSIHGKDVCEQPFMKIVCIKTDNNNITENYIDVFNAFVSEYPTITVMSIFFVVTSQRLIDMPNCYIMVE